MQISGTISLAARAVP